MSIFNNLEPTVLKEHSSIQDQIDALKNIYPKASKPVQDVINQDLTLLEMGLYGENRVLFELKNSHIPMYIIHDLYLQKDDLNAQIDYLVICPSKTYVIESKNLFGNIEINNKGDFIRTIQKGKFYQKEGIYSPITQNIRHIELMKSIALNNKLANIANALLGDSFNDSHIPVVVLANDKTVLNDKYAKKEIKNQVIRVDQLINFIKKHEKQSSSILTNRTNSEMKKSADFWMGLDLQNKTDYIEKYRNLEREYRKEKRPVNNNQVPKCPNCNIEMVKRIARSGERKGKYFWGCPNYPKCKNIINID